MKTREPVYTLVVPVTHRAGPGHKSHLSPKKGTTVCQVENNLSHGLRPLGFGIKPSSDIDHLRREADRRTCRKLCGNCLRIAGADQ